MDKLLLMSVLVVAMLAPTLAAYDRVAVRGLKRMMVVLIVFNTCYLAALILIYTRYYYPEWSP
jgi:hypothetical protein